jgi:hypothetical protein
MKTTAPEQDQLAEQLGHLGQAEFAGFINDISADPRHAQILKSKKDREADAVDYQWTRFQEDCEFEAACRTVPSRGAQNERLRSERDPGQGEEPLEKIFGELPEKGGNATSFRPGRAELPLAKRAGGSERGNRLAKILKRATTAFALGEEPGEDVMDDFRALLGISGPKLDLELQK